MHKKIVPDNWTKNDKAALVAWFEKLPIVKNYDEMLEIDKNYELKKIADNV